MVWNHEEGNGESRIHNEKGDTMVYFRDKGEIEIPHWYMDERLLATNST